ncbi:YopJ family acetyltransferase [Vagococcus sp. WN89Y]|uniref:YopJ family acetyltransferase n=1 Tax=Vagococcus sp. WN89Y TaxID=3457258 RepID=UPI003FCD837D
MPRFRMTHAKNPLTVCIQKGFRNIRRNLSRMMNSLKSVKPTPTPLKQMSMGKNSAPMSVVAKNIVTIAVKDNAAVIYPDHISHHQNKSTSLPSVNANTQPAMARDISPSSNLNQHSAEIKDETATTLVPAEREKIKGMLGSIQEYKKLTEKAYFKGDKMPPDEMMDAIWEAEEKVFPQVLDAFNARHKLSIKYTLKSKEITDMAVNRDWNGRQQFIFDSGNHSVFADLYKDSNGNISVITIDTLTSTNDFCTESLLARAFNEREIHEGKFSLLSFKTEAQKNYQGCKYFNMHFAKTAAKDALIVELHKGNINITKEQAAKNHKNDAPGEYIKRKPHPHTFISVAETAEYLNARYYKHSHSSSRLFALPLQRRKENIFKGANVIERSSKFRVQKRQIIEETEAETQHASVKERVLNFSNSLDHFRRKRIIEAEAFLQARLA